MKNYAYFGLIALLFLFIQAVLQTPSAHPPAGLPAPGGGTIDFYDVAAVAMFLLAAFAAKRMIDRARK